MSEEAISRRVDEGEVAEISKVVEAMKSEIGKVFFGHEETVESLVRALLCDGHVLVEGVPGIAKTLAVKTLAKVSGCSSKRVQFTVDLLPTDIIGLTTYNPESGFEVVKGPIFANFIIADEINRSPPKTQSALIEAMQEKQVTIGRYTYALPKPFFVMANQNPLENEGVYSLPEAQIDRFLFKIKIGYPNEDVEGKVMEENVSFRKFEDLDVKAVTSPKDIIGMQMATRDIYVDDRVKKYILDIVKKTRDKDFEFGKYIHIGGSPRASIALFIAAKAQALIKGRNYVIPEDVRSVVLDCLRHRVVLSYRAKGEGIESDDVIGEILKIVKVG